MMNWDLFTEEYKNAEFDFYYSIKQSDFIKYNALKVDVSIYTEIIHKKPIIENNNLGNINTNKLIANIQSDSINAKSAVMNQEKYVLANRKSDITAFINNQKINEIKNGNKQFKTKLKTVLLSELKEKNENVPILSLNNYKIENVYNELSSTLNQNSQKLNYDLILKRGIDPQNILNLKNNLIESHESFNGTNNLGINNNDLNLSNLLKYYTISNQTLEQIRNQVKVSDDLSTEGTVNIISSVEVDELEIPVRLKFQQPTNGKDVFIEFCLLDNNDNIIDLKIKKINLTSQIKAYNVPYKAPIVKYARTNNGINLQITQKSGNEIQIYKKVLNSSSLEVENYEFYSSYALNINDTLNVKVDSPITNTIIYRVISCQSGLRSSAYTSVVINSKIKSKSKKVISVTSITQDNGVLLEIRNLPYDVNAVKFLQRNLTIHQKDYEQVGELIQNIDNVKETNYVSTLAMNVKQNNAYEFSALLYYNNGVQEYASCSEIIEFIKATPNLIDLKIENLNILRDSEPNVNFTINLTLLDTEVDQIKSLLHKQGINEYDDIIANQRDQLKSLFAYSIQRVNLNTGEKEDFGVCTNFNFDDKKQRENYSIKPLKYGIKYRYIITALSRTTETMLNVEKIITDNVTKKSYKFMPSKFLHPLTLNRGIVISQLGLKTLYSKSQLEHGILGVTTTLDVSFNDVVNRVNNLSATRINKKYVLLTWNSQLGNDIGIDHFIITKIINNTPVVIGFTHNQFANNNCYWYHEIKHDIGEIKYAITPVLNDYTMQKINTIYSNSLLIKE